MVPSSSRRILLHPHKRQKPFTALESKWISSLRVFLAEHDMHLQIDKLFIPKIQRQYDVHLMDLILDSTKYTPREIRGLNYCRLYLQATTVSDICLVDGKTLDPAMLQGTFSQFGSRTKGLTIYQERPSETEWTLWRRIDRKSTRLNSSHVD